MLFNSTNLKKYFLIGLIYLLVAVSLIIKTIFGFDMTDEMQYYGQISGLIDSNSLFENDLFFQQTVYLIFYPIIKIYSLFFGQNSLIIFSRTILALLIFSVFIYSYLKIISLGVDKYLSSIYSFALTFTIPFHGVFALSYNTVSQSIWIIFLLNFYDWKNKNIFLLSLLISFMSFAHPTSAISVFFIIFIRLVFSKEFVNMKLLLKLLIFEFMAIALFTLQFSSFNDYLSSLIFSSGFEVGSMFFSNLIQLILFLFISIILFFPFLKLSELNSFLYKINFQLSFIIYAIVIITFFYFDHRYYGYSPRNVILFSGLLGLSLLLFNKNFESFENRKYKDYLWLLFSFFIYLLTISVTSGNGISQSIGPLMIAICIINFLNSVNKGFRNKNLLLSCCILFIFIFYANNYSYREVNWWKATEKIEGVSEFNGLRTSSNRISFIEKMQSEFSFLKNSSLLLVSEFPAIYFILNTKPETCMFYMHSIRSKSSETELLNCLNKKNPNYILNINEDSFFKDKAKKRVIEVVKEFSKRNNYKCQDKEIFFKEKSKQNFNPDFLKYSICEKS